MDRFNCGLIELKLAPAANVDEMTFSGYGAVFGNVDTYGDMIAKGAFTDTVKQAKATGIWPAMLSQHGGWGMSADDNTPIGVWTDMKEDSTGLYLEGKMAPTVRGIEMHTLMKMTPRPAISGLSIGYIATAWTNGNGKDEPRRTLTAVQLMEISPVTFPANGKARVQSVKNEITIRTAERALRDAGFSQSEAKRIVSAGFKTSTTHRDDGGLADIAAMLRQNTQSLKQ